MGFSCSCDAIKMVCQHRRSRRSAKLLLRGSPFINSERGVLGVSRPNVHPRVLRSIEKDECAFPLAAAYSISGGKCKVPWDTVFALKRLEVLMILNMDEFACAMRLCWT